MERSKIPKSGIPKSLKPATTTRIQPPNILQPLRTNMHVLRRRSKSATDLRPRKPILATKTAQKRPAASNSTEETRPKVPKMKIPDWDYKSRFAELQKKHQPMAAELRQTKEKLANLPELEQKLNVLSDEKTELEVELRLTKTQEKEASKDLKIAQTELATLKTDYADLMVKHESLEKKHKEVEERHLALEEEVAKGKLQVQRNLEEITSLKTDHANLKAKHESLEKRCKELEGRHLALEEEVAERKLQEQRNLHEISSQKKELDALKRELCEQHDLRRSLHNRIQDLKGNIRVFCRVRPHLDSEAEKELCSFVFPDEVSVEIRKTNASSQEFGFDKVFSAAADQLEVFEEVAELVQSALDGYNVCVFAYGQTSSGKTYTMQGTPEHEGIIPRTVDLLFDKIAHLATMDWSYKVSASFLEIYNENIRDLLVPNSNFNYEVRYNEGRGITVTNLKIFPVSSSSELKTLMLEAQKNRVTATTDYNQHSSRSHAVTKIYIEGHNLKKNTRYISSINLVDLAGSENAKASKRMQETKKINSSLSSLGNVMLALHKKEAHVPYRNSKLTFLLQSSLGGNSKSLMFVNIAPFEECFAESVSSLRFAAMVKDVKTNARKNKVYSS